MSLFSVYNGKIVNAAEALLHPDNRSFRYGEGLFETIRMQNAKMPLWDAHWKRLSETLPALYFSLPIHFTSEQLKAEVLQLAKKNKCTDAARVRITVFKGEGGIWETPTTSFNYLIQCWPLEKKDFSMNENGLDIGVFEAGRKSCDAFSNYKTNNYLLYALAAQYAKQQKWNECLVLNQHQRICDATISNVFFISENEVCTPALQEGCVSGVMRSFLLEQFMAANIKVNEGAYEISDLQKADELFFSNAMYGIRWAKLFGNKVFSNQISNSYFQKFVSPLFK